MRAEVIRRAKDGMLDDEDLQQLISERFDEDPSFWTGTGKNRMEITVEVSDGHVTLRGAVRTAQDRRRADLLARSLGATGVDNRLIISDESSRSPKSRRSA
jgi:osmotically-inducible protein OsmY